MLKMLIVDDEPMVLIGIKTVFNWSELGIEIVAEASNGEQALLVFDRMKPDIVITDVRMPKIDGMELSRYIKKISPDTEIIILSGFDEFEYAKNAVKLGAMDYLLKPIEKNELITSIQKITSKIEKRKRFQNDFQNIQEKMVESMPLLKNNFLLNLLKMGVVNMDELSDLFSYYGIRLGCKPFYLIKMDMDEVPDSTDVNGYEKLNLKKMTIKSYIMDTFIGLGEVEAFEDYSDIYLILEPESIYNDELSEEILQRCTSSIDQLVSFAEIGFSAGVSKLHKAYLELPMALEECDMALEYRFYEGKGKCILAEYIELSYTISYSLPKNVVDTLVTKMRLYQKEEVIKLLRKVFFEIDGMKRTHIDYYYSICMQILLELYNLAIDSGLKNKVFLESISIEKIKNKTTKEELFQFMQDRISDILDVAKSLEKDKRNLALASALDYINKNFSRSITLADVAENSFVNKNYLCHLFKKELDVSYLDYLTDRRIREAKHLLKSVQYNYKTYEVATMVGYNDYTYFSQVFKKNTGMTPSEYRNMTNF